MRPFYFLAGSCYYFAIGGWFIARDNAASAAAFFCIAGWCLRAALSERKP